LALRFGILARFPRLQKIGSNILNKINVLLLSAGYGTRLRPLTDGWPKCLMPVHGIPLLEYWLSALKFSCFSHVYVNSHHHAQVLDEYLSRKRFFGWVKNLYEYELLGTAATIRENEQIFLNKPLLLIHSDNWTSANINEFLTFSLRWQSSDILLTMLTFRTDKPESCGVLSVDEGGLAIEFQEKSNAPRSNLANGAVYFLSSDLVNLICRDKTIIDFSTDLIPNLIGKILTWHNTGYHRDIGTLESLIKAQKDPKRTLYWPEHDRWMIDFRRNPIHKKMKAFL